MNYQELLATLTAEMIERFRSALETGRWPDGKELNDRQREDCMQAIILWEQENVPPEQRVGYIPKPDKSRATNTESINTELLTGGASQPARNEEENQ